MKKHIHPVNFIDLTGKKFKSWTVMYQDIEKSKQKERAYWVCQCICGKERINESYQLRSGKVAESCGCLTKQRRQEYESTPEFQQPKRLRSIYKSMKSRCTNPNNNEYFRYGARGITVCDRWLESFDNFKEDMFDSYIEFESINGLNSATIDRIDSTGNYELSNCRWLTLQQQSRNRKDNLPSTVRGKDYGTIMELIEDYPYLEYSTVQGRYHRGVRGEDLIKPPARGSKYRQQYLDNYVPPTE